MLNIDQDIVHIYVRIFTTCNRCISLCIDRSQLSARPFREVFLPETLKTAICAMASIGISMHPYRVEYWPLRASALLACSCSAYTFYILYIHAVSLTRPLIANANVSNTYTYLYMGTSATIDLRHQFFSGNMTSPPVGENCCRNILNKFPAPIILQPALPPHLSPFSLLHSASHPAFAASRQHYADPSPLHKSLQFGFGTL